MSARPPCCCLIRQVDLGLVTVHHRDPLLHEVTLRWPGEPSRSDALLAHSLRQQGGEVDTASCAVNLAFPADRSTSRVRGNAVRAVRARLVGEGMLRQEAMKASLSTEVAPHPSSTAPHG